MAHTTTGSAYSKFIDRINLNPQGAPASEKLFAILKILFNEKEAELLSYLPIKPFSAKEASKIWKKGLQETKSILKNLASRAMIVDILNEPGEYSYVLPPPMAGFFEFSLMRLQKGSKVQQTLSELYYQYINVEDDFVKELFTVGETQLGRIFVKEKALPPETPLVVLDYERASHVIKSASHIGIGTCYCRHKMKHVGKNCDTPMKDFCFTFNTTAASLIKNGHIEQIDVKRAMSILEKTNDYNLVQFGENVRKRVNFICNCCRCCCEGLIAARKFGFLNPVSTSNFIPEVDVSLCNGCGACASVCPVDAMEIIPAIEASEKNQKKAKVDKKICLGCGICVSSCKKGAISLRQLEARVITPLDSVHRTVVMAIERGKLQNLIFDKQVYWSHRAMAAIFGVLLRLPPVKQLMASRQIKSKFFEKIISIMDV